MTFSPDLLPLSMWVSSTLPTGTPRKTYAPLTTLTSKMKWTWIPVLLVIAWSLAQDQLEFDDFSDKKESSDFFESVHPLSYTVNLQLPLEVEEQEKSGPKYKTKGSMAVAFKWVPASGIFQSQRLLALHSKSILIKQDSINLWQLQHLTGQKQKALPIDIISFKDAEELVTFRLSAQNQLQAGEIYRLEIGEFDGKIEDDGSKNGIFLTSPGLATQFQLNDARRAFPCVDTPGKKAVFAFSITHPATYAALFNTDMDAGDAESADEKTDGWVKTVFRSTPLMSTYTLGFTLMPKSFVEKAVTTKASDGLRVSIFYNPERLTNPRQPAALLKYASQAYEILRRTFSPRLPLTKLDVCVVKGLSILGMENWGLVNLKEEFVLKENEIEQFGLLTHEFVHQWIGNLATTADWKNLCVQEGLTEHYSRRTLADFYGGTQSAQYQRYVFVRYLPAIQNETNNVGLKPIRQNFQGFDEAVTYCFGRVPFIWTMIERIVGGRQPFDEMINRFLTDFAFKNFVLDDLALYLSVANASRVLEYYLDHGGYPSLFVQRLNETTFRLRQRQIIPLAGAVSDTEPSFEIPSTKDVWPIPLSTTDGQRVMVTSEYDLPSEMIPFDSRRVPLVNPDFAYFYRINYDAVTWVDIADALQSAAQNYSEITKAQFLNDFCFFRGLNLIRGPPVNGTDQDNKAFINRLTKKFLDVQNQLELSTDIFVRFYTKGC